MAKGRVACAFALCLLGNAFCLPLDGPRTRRGYSDNELDSEELFQGDMSTQTSSVAGPPSAPLNPAVTLPPVTNSYDEKRKEFQTPEPSSLEDDDDDFPESLQTSPSRGGGSNILSLLSLVNGLFPSSGANFQALLTNMIREYIRRHPQPLVLPQNKLLRRQGIIDNEIDIDYTFDLKPPPFQRQESDENGSDNDSHASESREESRESREESRESIEDSKESREEADDSEENNAAEESIEDDDNGNDNASQQNSDSKPASDGNGDNSDGDNDSDYDSDEPPGGGDGEGGGILGILAGLSGGEDGQSDLGSLLATISGIVVNLSGDGIDLNSLIASGIGLFVGLLSEGEENPGTIVASYLLTSLDTISGGGAKNNGAFFGKFLSKLISGTSAGEPPEGASDESGSAEGMKDSAGFLLSLLMGLSGDMSKGSSKGSSQPW